MSAHRMIKDSTGYTIKYQNKIYKGLTFIQAILILEDCGMDQAAMLRWEMKRMQWGKK